MMKTIRRQNLIAAALVGALAFAVTSAYAEAINTRIGELSMEHGIPGKAWFMYFRAYGLLKPFFDRSWVLPDVERVK